MRLAGPRVGGVGERGDRQRMLEGAERLGGVDDRRSARRGPGVARGRRARPGRRARRTAPRSRRAPARRASASSGPIPAGSPIVIASGARAARSIITIVEEIDGSWLGVDDCRSRANRRAADFAQRAQGELEPARSGRAMAGATAPPGRSIGIGDGREYRTFRVVQVSS